MFEFNDRFLMVSLPVNAADMSDAVSGVHRP